MEPTLNIKMSESALRQQICEIGALMHRLQLIESISGNISARLPDGNLLITPSGLAKGFMQPDQLIVIDLNGNKVRGADDLIPSSETPMHTEVYRQRMDVQGVVHAHPPHVVALSIAGIDFQQLQLPEAIIMLGNVPTTAYATPSGTENRDAIASLIAHHDAIVLAYHGSLTVASDVWTAYLKLESLEHTARILYMVHQLGGGTPLPAHQLEKLWQLHARFHK